MRPLHDNFSVAYIAAMLQYTEKLKPGPALLDIINREFDLNECDDIIEHALETVPERERHMLNCRYKEGLTFREIGNLHHMSEGCAGAAVQNAIKRLAKRTRLTWLYHSIRDDDVWVRAQWYYQYIRGEKISIYELKLKYIGAIRQDMKGYDFRIVIKEDPMSLGIRFTDLALTPRTMGAVIRTFGVGEIMHKVTQDEINAFMGNKGIGERSARELCKELKLKGLLDDDVIIIS